MKRKVMAVVGSWALAAAAVAVEVGQPAPEFSAPATNGESVSPAGLKGKWVVLYFYPKSFTPGCTKEACSLRDGYGEIQKLGAVILGSSFQDLETQKKFKAEHQLPFELLADTKKEVAKAFDAVGLAGLMPQRKTFILDPEGKVAWISSSVNVEHHDAEVRSALQMLQNTKDK